MRVLLLALLVSAPAFAWQADNSNNLKDVQYIPKAMTLYGQTALSHEKAEYTIESQDDNSDTETRSLDQYVTQTIGFGFTDSFSAYVTLAHQFNGEVDEEDNAGNNSPEEDVTGTKNPIFRVNLRIMDQAADGINFDLVLAFAPDLFDAETDSNKHESTVAQGGHAVVVGARVGKKFKELQMSGEAYVNYFGDSESEDTATDVKTKTDAVYQTVVKYNVQTDILPILDWRGSVASIVTLPYEYKEGNTKTEVDMSNRWELSNMLIWSVVPDTFLVSFDWTMHKTWSHEVKSGGTKFDVNDFRGHDLELAATYQF